MESASASSRDFSRPRPASASASDSDSDSDSERWTNISDYDLQVPIDCEFIIVQPTDDDLYKLTEIYQFKTTSFSFDYGTWHGVLNITPIPFFKRRSNLNGTNITVLSVRAYSEDVSCIRH